MIRKFLKYSLNAQGFTLAEGMVTASLLGVVSLAMLQGLKEDGKTKAFARINDDIVMVMGSINNSMKDNRSCTATLSSVTPVAKSAAGGTVANVKIVAANNITVTNLTSPHPQFLTAIISAGTDVAPGLAISSIRAVNFATYFNMNSDLDDSTFVAGSTYKYGSIELELGFSQTLGGGSLVVTERSILVNVKLNSAGAILSCVNLADLTALQLKKQICGITVKGQDGTTDVTVGSFIPSTGECEGIQESLNSISAQKICTELGGKLGGAPDYACIPFGSQGGTTCINGFKQIVNGVPECL